MPDPTLLCPGTLRPAPMTEPEPVPAAARRARPAPATPEPLATLLRRARVLDRWRDDDAVPLELPHERWLRARVGLPAGCTVEALSAHADGVAPPALRLTPVHLRVARDHLVLTDPAQLSLDADDAAALAAVAAPVFAEQGLRLDTTRADGRWYLGGDALPTLTARAWTLATGRNVDAWSASGADARRWRKLVNEVQMLWHIDPVNERRMERGLPPLNGLWLDGAAAPALEAAVPFTAIVSDDPALVGLARLAGIPARPAATEPSATRSRAGAAPSSADDLGPAPLQVLDGWRRHLRDPVADGGRGLRDAAADAIRRRFDAGTDRLTVVLTGDREGVVLSLARADGWKFWQRVDPSVLAESAR